ncbi:hypothetical protein EV193_10217 [Herbihabitans rhizosphaerae]|uniref:Uncharacterized protein n=1 Tax=Herbihabitans rhizosphaerae TaxID=1872711 RepID=A0A4Q7L3K6_9PSEU|nr:hypothetical protein EV193_10217 [Herbihabitans rhizosphaerae]
MTWFQSLGLMAVLVVGGPAALLVGSLVIERQRVRRCREADEPAAPCLPGEQRRSPDAALPAGRPPSRGDRRTPPGSDALPSAA